MWGKEAGWGGWWGGGVTGQCGKIKIPREGSVIHPTNLQQGLLGAGTGQVQSTNRMLIFNIKGS